MIGLLQVEDEKIRSASRQALIDLGEPAVDPLIGALETADDDLIPVLVQILTDIGEPALDSLINALADPDKAVREIAREAIIRIGARAVDPLIVVLAAEDKNKRTLVKEALLEIGSPAIQPLVAVLDDPDRQPAAAELLVEFGEPAIEPLIKALMDEELAAPAAEVLVDFGASAVAPVVRALQEHPEIGAASSVPLVSALKNDHPSVRSAATDGLAAIGEPAVARLLDLVKENHTLTVADTIYYADRVVYAPPGSATGKLVDGGLCTDKGSWKGKIVLCKRGENSFIDKVLNVQDSGGVGVVFYNDIAGAILATLGKDIDAEIPVVAINLEQGDYLVKNELDVVAKVFSEEEIKSAAAAQVIKEIGEPAIPHLISALSDDILFETAQDVLESLGAPAVTALLEALQDHDKIVRYRVLSVLGEMGNKRTFGPIVASLQDEQALVRRAAVAAVGKFKDAEAIEPLIAMLNDEDKAVRQEAVDSLGEIGLPAVDSLLKIYNQEEYLGLRPVVADGLRDIFGQQQVAIFNAAAKACSGEGLPGAEVYRRSEAGPHPMVILNKYNNIHSWTLRLPVDWLPYTPEQLQVVVCMEGQERIVVQNCAYRYRNTGMSAPSIIRYRYYNAGALFAASSGAKLAGFKLNGSQPDSCPATKTTNMTTIEGGQVGYTDLVKWLKTYGLQFMND